MWRVHGKRQVGVLLLAASQAGALALKQYGLPDHVCDAMSRRAKRLNLIRFAQKKLAERHWTAEELEILANEVDDAEVAVNNAGHPRTRQMR